MYAYVHISPPHTHTYTHRLNADCKIHITVQVLYTVTPVEPNHEGEISPKETNAQGLCLISLYPIFQKFHENTYWLMMFITALVYKENASSADYLKIFSL